MAEAAFTSSQIERIQRFCETHKYTLKIYWIDVPREVALARIQEDARRHADDPHWLPYHEARVRIAREMNAPETTKNLPIQFLDQNFDIRKDSKP
jgi:predicted kinase